MDKRFLKEIKREISKNDGGDLGYVAYLSALGLINEVDPTISSSIVKEIDDQRSNLKMIASENYCSLPVQLAQANLLTDKYAEGFPYHRFYAGCENVDQIEGRAADLACKLYGADHAYVQPHSGADANLIAYWSILASKVQDEFVSNKNKKDISNLSEEEWKELRGIFGNQKLLAMNYYSGGHLTHGYRHNFSSRMFECASYDVREDTNLIDYDEVRDKAKSFKPLILLAGYSAYSRKINFRIFKEIADEIGAVLMVDMAHFSGLVAGKVFEGEFNPVNYADIVTSTTHKTLRGPRGGMILCKSEFADNVDKGCPLVIGGPLPHVMAAKAVAFSEANSQSFVDYAHSIVSNAKVLAQTCIDNGLDVLTGGTDNHLLLINVGRMGLTGRMSEKAVRDAGITLNRNSIPFDPNGAWYTSGLRIGTPATTTLGMGADEMKKIGDVLSDILKNMYPAKITKGNNAGKLSKANYVFDNEVLNKAREKVKSLLDKYPVYPGVNVDFLKNICQ